MGANANPTPQTAQLDLTACTNMTGFLFSSGLLGNRLIEGSQLGVGLNGRVRQIAPWCESSAAADFPTFTNFIYPNARPLYRDFDADAVYMNIAGIGGGVNETCQRLGLNGSQTSLFQLQVPPQPSAADTEVTVDKSSNLLYHNRVNIGQVVRRRKTDGVNATVIRDIGSAWSTDDLACCDNGLVWVAESKDDQTQRRLVLINSSGTPLRTVNVPFLPGKFTAFNSHTLTAMGNDCIVSTDDFVSDTSNLFTHVENWNWWHATQDGTLGRLEITHDGINWRNFWDNPVGGVAEVNSLTYNGDIVMFQPVFGTLNYTGPWGAGAATWSVGW